MKDLRERYEKLADELVRTNYSVVDTLEAFARKIRNEALEEAAATLTCIGECEHCEGCEHAAEIRNLETKEEQ